MYLILMWFSWYFAKAGLGVSDMVDHYLPLTHLLRKSCSPTQMMQFCRVPRMCSILSTLVSYCSHSNTYFFTSLRLLIHEDFSTSSFTAGSVDDCWLKQSL